MDWFDSILYVYVRQFPALYTELRSQQMTEAAFFEWPTNVYVEVPNAITSISTMDIGFLANIATFSAPAHYIISMYR